jgi:hypothetical protein
VLKTAVVILGVVLATASVAAERKDARPRAADKQSSAERPPAGKSARPLPRHDPALQYCGGRSSGYCILLVF